MNRIQEKKIFPPLYAGYLRGTSGIKELYGGHYGEQHCYEEKLSFLRSSYPGTSRRLLTQALIPYNKDLGAGAETLKNIELLLRSNTAVVVTGQQAGLLGGPLYTFYKAAAAVTLSRRLSRELQTPVVPVFWIAAEDHDFGEVNHIFIQDRQGSPRKLELGGGNGFHPLERVPLNREEALTFLQELSAAVPETEFKGEIIHSLMGHMEESASLTQWFGRVMAWLFKDSGLVFFNPLLPGIRSLAAPVLGAIGRQREAVDRALKKRDEEIEAMGYPLQVKREEGHLNLFAFLPGGRAALFWKDGRVWTRQGEDLGSLEDVVGDMERDPTRYGPGVLTRPLVQEAFLPVLAYIGGPGEVSYFAQLAPLFSLLGQRPPVLYPRPSVTLLEPRMARYVDRYSLKDGDLFRLREALETYLKGQGRDKVDHAFGKLEERLALAYTDLKETLGEIDRGLIPLTEKNLGRVLKEAAYLKEKGQKALENKHGGAVRHFRNLENSCLPGGRLQERVYNIFPYLIKYGPGFSRQLQGAIPLEGNHYIHRWETMPVSDRS